MKQDCAGYKRGMCKGPGAPKGTASLRGAASREAVEGPSARWVSAGSIRENKQKGYSCRSTMPLAGGSDAEETKESNNRGAVDAQVVGLIHASEMYH